MVRTHGRLQPELHLTTLMSRELVSVTPEATLREVVELLAERHLGGMPVLAGGRAVGVISMSDIVTFLASTPPVPADTTDTDEWDPWCPPPGWREGEDAQSSYFVNFWEDAAAEVVECVRHAAGPAADVLAESTAAEVMTPFLHCLPPDATAAEAAAYMLRAQIHRVLVVENGMLLGLVTTTDLLRAIT